jgi:hypothetical protein
MGGLPLFGRYDLWKIHHASSVTFDGDPLILDAATRKPDGSN